MTCPDNFLSHVIWSIVFQGLWYCIGYRQGKNYILKEWQRQNKT
jgi:hypothetical protein